MKVLGIETTCDETGCSVVEDGHTILSNVITTQIDLHEEYGGVVPELACRRHVDVFIPVLDRALKEAETTLEKVDLIAVSQGPGLIGALLIGLHAAKALAWSLRKPLIGINHIEAHLYAALMSSPEKVVFPCLGLVLSGGHTSLVLMQDIGTYQLIGQTVDDAIGEAFDKVAKMFGLPYPGGPRIEKLALQGDPTRYHFKPGQVKGRPFDFSFSGLKTAVLYACKGQSAGHGSPLLITEEDKHHIAAAFQEAAFSDIIKKTRLAVEQFGCKTVVFGGGVTCNLRLRQLLAERCPGLQCLWPSQGLSLDNAAMVAGLGYHRFLKHGGSTLELEASTEMPF